MSGTAFDQRASYEAKPDIYYGAPRLDYVAELPKDPGASILEVGCAAGTTGAAALAEGKCNTYVGIELFEPAAARAKQRLTDVLVGNVETMDIPLPPRSFDALIIAEVIEHMIDPAAVLARIAPLMRPGARVFASSPCISHWSNIVNLVQGRFEYTDTGMMDRTHLRWFTPDSFARLFKEAGFVDVSVAPLNKISPKARLVRRILGRRFDALWYYQIDLRGRMG